MILTSIVEEHKGEDSMTLMMMKLRGVEVTKDIKVLENGNVEITSQCDLESPTNGAEHHESSDTYKVELAEGEELDPTFVLASLTLMQDMMLFPMMLLDAISKDLNQSEDELNEAQDEFESDLESSRSNSPVSM
jgi:hypothetical protein